MSSPIESAVGVGNDVLWTYILIVLLIGLGVYFTVRTRFVQFRLFGDSARLLGAGTDSGTGVSSFGAFAVGTAARVGTGNLAGVELANIGREFFKASACHLRQSYNKHPKIYEPGRLRR